MKKYVLLLLTSLLLNSTPSQALPKWIKQIFGCTWAWIGKPELVGAGSHPGLCKYEQKMKGTSWLWGDCGTHLRTWESDCTLPNSNRPELPNGFEDLQNDLLNLQAAGYSIPSSWLDTLNYHNPTIRQQIAEYRLQLAGYEPDESWFTLEEDPCPVPTPTVIIQVPQTYQYINENCVLATIYPNPSSGHFTVDMTDIYTSVNSLSITRESDQQLVETVDNNFQAIMSFDLTNQPSGAYWVHIYLNDGVMAKKIILQ